MVYLPRNKLECDHPKTMVPVIQKNETMMKSI